MNLADRVRKDPLQYLPEKIIAGLLDIPERLFHAICNGVPSS